MTKRLIRKVLTAYLPCQNQNQKTCLMKQEFRVQNLWLGRQFWNQTFEDDVEVKVREIRRLLDMDDDCDEAA
jgi:hypothetical protein